MHSSPFLVDCLLNNSTLVKSLVDTGCLCFAVFDEKLVRQNNFMTRKIDPIPLYLANRTVMETITEIACIKLTISGYPQTIYGYVVPRLAYPMILGKPWMEYNNVVYLAKQKCLRIGSRRKGRIVQQSKDFHKCSTLSLLGAASLADVMKALQDKQPASKDDISTSLPIEIRHFTNLFLDDEVSPESSLPPHRKGTDTTITLQKDVTGRDKEIPWGRLYKMSREELLVLRKELSNLLKKNWIRPSTSPGGAPVLFVKKPNGGLRLCIDYRNLNAITERDRYPLPLVTETLRLLSRAKWISKVDVRTAFHRLRIKEGDEWKTAFRTQFGSYEWLVTPFGLAGAPAAFQRWVNSVLGNLLGDFCAAYLDDIIIFSDADLNDHWAKVNCVLSRLAKAGLKLDPRKCEFASKSTKYLGFVIEAEIGIKMDPEKVQAIVSWDPPKNVKGVRQFLGFANFYRSFIDKYTDLVAPLQLLTYKNSPFHWSEDQQTAFDSLKRIFTTAPVLAMWHEDRETVVETDASGWATGGCLSQFDSEGRLHPVAYYSKKLTPTECNYDIHDKELLSIIKCLQIWRGELIGLNKQFVILTDHKNLEYFMSSQKLVERQVRWAQILSQFNFRLEFRAGKKATKPDALSRRPQDIPENPNDARLREREFQLIKNNWLPNNGAANLDLCHINNLSNSFIPKGNVLFEDTNLQSLWDTAVTTDPTLVHIYNACQQGQRTFPSELNLKVSIGECQFDTRGALCFRNRIWIPNHEPLQTSLIQKTHDSHVTGHPGRNNTLAILSRSFYWPGMTNMVRKFCRNCDVCGRSHVWRSARQGFLLPLPVPERFYSELSIDFMTDMPAKNKSDPKFLMVITDRLLKSVTLEAMSSMAAEDCANRFVQCHYRFHGFPHAITSDRGSNWVSDFWTSMCSQIGIEQRLSTAFHPETDGATERMNQEVLAYLRSFISFAQFEWPSMLPSAQLAINNRNNSSSGLSPFFIQHGFHAEPIQQVVTTNSDPNINYDKRASIFLNRIREAQEFAAAAMASAQQQMEDQANRFRNPAPLYKVGDKVWLNLRNIHTPQLKKKLAWVNAKYRITKIISPHVVELDVPSKIYPRFNVKLLRRAGEDPLPSQVIDDPQPLPVLPDNSNIDAEPEQYIDRILRAERIRCGRGWKRRVLVKWKGFAEPNWEDRSSLEDTIALDEFEAKYGVGDGVGESEGARQGSKRKK